MSLISAAILSGGRGPADLERRLLAQPPGPRRTLCPAGKSAHVRCTKQCCLLDELDQRQDEVLAQLDDLNAQIERLIQECLTSRDEDQAPEGPRGLAWRRPG